MIQTLLRRAALALCALFVFSTTGTAQAQGPVSAYLAVRHSLRSGPIAGAQIGEAQANPAAFLGQTFEMTARVSGFVFLDNVRTVLLSLGTTSLAVRAPSGGPDMSWINSGQIIGALVRVDKTGNNRALSCLTLLAAAPGSDLDDARRAPPARPLLASRYAPPSRTLPYARQRRAAYAAMPAGPSAIPTGLSPRAQQIYAPYWNAVRGMNPRLAASDVDKITSSILYFSDQNDVDPRLIMAMIICESGFDMHSTSRTGAAGLGQLMPSTARGLGVTNAYDPVQNIAASVHLLRSHLDNYGGAPAHAGIIPMSQIALTMAAYNAGPGAVRRFHGVPPYRETRRYVAKVAALYQKMCGQGT